MQAAFLLGIWWYRVNWLIAFPFEGMGERLPPFFQGMALASLRGLPAGVFVSSDEYADELIRASRLTWGASESEHAQLSLRASVKRMIVYVLSDFGALQLQYRQSDDYPDKELSAIQVTPWGKTLLDAVHIIGRGRL